MIAGNLTPPFFVCGYPKTGTTFLQRTLNLHPQISCPSEQEFRALRLIVNRALTDYAQVLRMMDERTGGQGVPPYPPRTEDNMLGAMVRTLSQSLAAGKPIHGLNDNNLFPHIARYYEVFSDAKFIGIVRNPVDTGLSMWRHMKRLAREEPTKAKQHLDVIASPKGTVEGYLELVVPHYRLVVDQFIEFAAVRPNFTIVRYEVLVADKRAEIVRLLAFLGATSTDATVDEMVRDSSKDAMAATSRNPGFFGIGKNSGERVSVSRDFRESMLRIGISPSMEQLGYDIPTLLAEADGPSARV